VNSFIRTHKCSELSSKNLGESVTLCGWVKTRRDHGGVIFIDLRDRYGVTQVVFDPALEAGKDAHQLAHKIRSEFVLAVKGVVRERPAGMINTKLGTGEIEIACQELNILSEAKTPPFEVEDGVEVSENLRLQYRYLDLRRPSLQKNIKIRHDMLLSARNYLSELDFLEIETPILYKSTPEGARDFIVPSRLSPSLFYALPQSPQTLKQLLMISGFDRYFQMARCFRDEDLRADRQPEFSQIDIEASFINEENFFPIIEGMIQKIWKDVRGVDLSIPFERMSYREAMDRFGSDKPDTRFALELQDLSTVFQASTFRVFQMALEKDRFGKQGAIKAIKIMGGADKYSRKSLDELTLVATQNGAKGLLWMKVGDGFELQSPAAKFFTEEETKKLFSTLDLKKGDLVLSVSDGNADTASEILGVVRLEVAKRENLIPSNESNVFNFLWIIDWPLLEYDRKEERYYAKHHPFTSPAPDQIDDFVKGENLIDVRASAYDLVVNGIELGGGSLRIYRSDVQDAMFTALGLSKEEAKEKFGFFLEALSYGTPPHGGITFGIDRMAAILSGVGPIRDVMAFPKTQKGHCLMSGSPSAVEPNQLVELGISLRKTK